MSLTAIAWIALYCIGCALALLKHPVYGLVAYLLEYFNHPRAYWWGHDIPNLRWAFIIAIITLFSLMVHRKQLPNVSAPPYKWLLSLLFVALIVTYTSAASFAASWACLVDLVKLALLYFLIVNIVQTDRDYRILMWAILIGCFLFGWRAYQNPMMQHGRLEGLGAVDARSANRLASLLLISLPFLGFYFLTGRRWEKILSMFLAPFILNAIVLTGSRGAFVGILAMGLIALAPGIKHFKLKFVLALALGVITFYLLATDTFVDRMRSLGHSDELVAEDGSVSGRITSWKAGWQLVQDHPFGAGGEGFRTLSPIYIPEIVSRTGGARSPHSTYVKVITDWGFLGAVLWLGFLVHTLRRLRKLRKTRIQPRHLTESICLEAAIVGFLVAGVFTDRLYAEALYWLCAVSISLYHIAMRAQGAGTSLAENPDGNIANRWLVNMQIWKAYRTVGYAMSSKEHATTPAQPALMKRTDRDLSQGKPGSIGGH